MRKDTKARSIPQSVKKAVAERDSVGGWPCCLACGQPAPPERPAEFSCAHFISRAQGGLGIEENTITLCPRCHYRYDQTAERPTLRDFFREYLKEKYNGWNEEKLYYKKEA